MHLKDQVARYTRWARNGENSSIGRCFDIGGTVGAALNWHECNPDAEIVPANDDEGNGSLMRLAPIPMFFWRDRTQAVLSAALQSRTTHGGSDAARICALYTQMILAAAEDGATKESVLESVVGMLRNDENPALIAIFNDRSYASKSYNEIRGSGYVVHAVEAALWAFWSTDSFRDAVLAAANIGEDADTTAAIVGQLAGAFYGIEGIPADWRKKLVQGEGITELARRLVEAQG